ncbi:FxSxx-COOH system tetratricopeptide repeat protein [Streptomyces sp. NPDC050273]|uniref:FxSxx-COOH system tetratricopeptide repeat protein n=1 Tax=Streptomyces sp. NPDC050273 TaxID=3154933 RepID=UPI003437EEDF
MTAQDPQRIVNISAEGAGSVAAKEINGPVHIGDVVLRAADYCLPSVVSAPTGTNNLPKPRSSLLIGRDHELQKLRETVQSHEGAVVAQAMHGLGGVGKTALALHYAHTYRSDYSVVWWISAESADSVTAGIAALGFRLNPRLAVAESTSAESSEWAISWLQCHSGWLLVLDNVEDPELAFALIGQTSNGHHIVTSRVSVGWNNFGFQIGLDVLSDIDSVELLTRMSGVHGEEEVKRELSSELGRLPLALEHAAAYVQHNQVSFSHYLRLLRKIPAKALGYAARVGGNSVSVARTWQVTLQSIDGINPLAISILRILAWLGPDDIPREALYGFAEDEFDVDSALGLLSAHSMISLSPDSVSIHRLVQAVIREAEETSLNSASHPHVRAAIGIYGVLNLEPEISPDSWLLWRRLLPHIEAVSSLVSVENASDPARTVLYYAARFLRSQNQLEPALVCIERCVRMAEGDQGEPSNGPDALSCMNILGAILQELGHHGRAVEIFKELVRDSIVKCGELDPFTLSMKNNLAGAYQDADRMAEAIALFEQTLKGREESLPAGDPAIATTRHNLAGAYRVAGKPHRAVLILEKVVEDRKAKYGDKGIGTLNSMFNLAISYIDIENLPRAVRLLKHVLNEREEIFGPDDPKVTGVRGRLGDVYRMVKNSKRSIPLYEDNLKSATRVYGADDWRTIECGIPLAFAYQDVKESEKAIPLLRRVLEWQEFVHGESDHSAVMARNNLAIAYWLNGDNGIASEILEQAMMFCASVADFDPEVYRAVRVNLQNLKSGMPVTGASQFDIGSPRLRLTD